MEYVPDIPIPRKRTRYRLPTTRTRTPKTKNQASGSQIIPVKRWWWEERTSVFTGKTSGAFFTSPQDLWKAATEYFQWAEEHPLTTEKPVVVRGEVQNITTTYRRPYTIHGLCTFLGVDIVTWMSWRDSELLGEMVRFIEQIIWQQKFEGAVIGEYDAGIVARVLGIKEQVQGAFVVASYEAPNPNLARKVVDLSLLSTDELKILLQVSERIERHSKELPVAGVSHDGQGGDDNVIDVEVSDEDTCEQNNVDDNSNGHCEQNIVPENCQQICEQDFISEQNRNVDKQSGITSNNLTGVIDR